MKAIQFAHHGEPKEVLAVTDQPLPEPGESAVRVRVVLSPINPSDLLYVRGHYSGVTPAFPASVGFEGVGVVEALGAGAPTPGPTPPSFPPRTHTRLLTVSPTSRWRPC